MTSAPSSLDERITAILASADQRFRSPNCDPKFASAPPRSSSGSVHSAPTAASSKPTVVIVSPAPERPGIQGGQFRFPFPTSLQRAGMGTRMRGSFCATASLHVLVPFWTELPWFGPSGLPSSRPHIQIAAVSSGGQERRRRERVAPPVAPACDRVAVDAGDIRKRPAHSS